MKAKKRTMFFLVTVVILSAMVNFNSVFAFAETPTSVSVSEDTLESLLRWVNVSSVNTTLTYSGTTANCKAEIIALSGTTSIKADMYLYRKNSDNTYTLVESWLGQSASGDYLYISKTKAITKGNTYKLSVTAIVTRNGNTETVSGSTEVKAPN